MRKEYPAKPTHTIKGPKYGSEEFPTMSDREREIIKQWFAPIFLFGPVNNDPYTELAEKLGSTRQRAKQVYWIFLYQQKGHFFNYLSRERKIRGRLINRIKEYTEFLENPETLYQIIERAEDEVDEREKKQSKGGY